MTPRVSVLLTPDAGTVPPGSTAVIVDVLRATSVLVTAKLHGARAVIEAATPDEALALRGRHPGALLCGERDARRIEGFDLGNSPFEYGYEVVAGRDLVFASTNGSRSLRRARRARRRVLAAFLNASAVVEAVAADAEVVIVCSGKLARFSLEDTALAGWIGVRLAARGARLEGASAGLARRLAPADAAAVRALVQGSAQGRHLRTLGPEYARDVDYCSSLDLVGQTFEV